MANCPACNGTIVARGAKPPETESHFECCDCGRRTDHTGQPIDAAGNPVHPLEEGPDQIGIGSACEMARDPEQPPPREAQRPAPRNDPEPAPVPPPAEAETKKGKGKGRGDPTD